MRKFIPVEEVAKEWMKDPEFVAAYDALEDEFAVAAALIKARGEADMTQEQVARAMGTTQAVVARLESGRTMPSTRTLERFAKATRTRLRISFEPAKRRRFAGVGVFAGRLSDRGSIAFDVENIVGDLECFSDNGAEAVERQSLMFVGPAESRSGDAAIAQQRARLHRLQLFDVRQVHLRRRRRKPAFCREIEHLASGHAAEPGRACKPEHERDADRGVRVGLRPCQDVECKREQAIAYQNGSCLVECLVQRRPAAAQVIIVHRRQVVVYKRIAMDAFERCGRHQAQLLRHRKQRRAFDHEKRAEPLAAAEARIAHGVEQASRAGTLARNRAEAKKSIEKSFGQRRNLAEARLEQRAAVFCRHAKSFSSRASIRWVL